MKTLLSPIYAEEDRKNLISFRFEFSQPKIQAIKRCMRKCFRVISKHFPKNLISCGRHIRKCSLFLNKRKHRGKDGKEN